ncbi:MAG TPA: condensation domain-containing protein, partial [Vicinamibacteria bacterium]|nr:condensation domain-containing protein [Vicinamibacteria bacterium]
MSEKTTVATLGAVEFDPFAGPAILTTAPSTEPQREIWTAVRMGDEASLAFNESVSVVLQGAFDLAAARASLADLVARHESLRSTFTADGLTLCVSADAPPDVPLVDLSRATAAERDAERARVLVAAVTTPFDLERGPLFRAVVLRLSPEEHQVVLTGHHIVVDGWSWAVLIADWAKLYAARRDGQPAALPPAERFSEHAREEAVRQRGPELLADENYWLKQFAGEIPVLDLPPDRARPNLKTFASRREDIRLGAELVQQLKRTGAKEGSSFFTILLAGFKVLVHRLTGQEDVVVGMPAAGQAAVGKNGLVGHCVNNLPLRSRVLPGTPFRDLLKSVRGTVLDAYEHQAHTFGSLLRKLPLPRDPSRQPLAPVAFNLDQTLPPEALRPFGAGARFSSNPRHYEMFDLFVNAVEDDGGVVLECQYNTDLYDGASVRRWMKSYEVLLAAVAQDAGRAIGDLPVLDEAERQVILFDWNRTKPSPRPEATLHQVFAEQARQRSEAVAVIHGDTALSYGELDRRSSQLAHALRRLGVSPGVLVGVCLERSLDTVVTLLGILKAGGGYLPLEHSYPKERLSFMLEDAGVGLVVTQSSLESILPAFAGRTFCLDRERDALAAENGANAPDSGATAESLCYVIYTSGSTGKPKGVLVPHRGPIRLLCGVEYLDLNADTVLLHSGNLAFDVSTAEIWGGLVNGGRCVLHTENVLTGGGLAEAIARHGVNTWITTTAIFNSIVDEDPALFRGLRQIVVGGEAMSVAHARRFQEAQPQIELINAYGPTEATVISTTCSVPVPLPREARSVPIGRPIADTTHYVLDER